MWMSVKRLDSLCQNVYRLQDDVERLTTAIEQLTVTVRLDRSETLSWVKGLMDRYVELSMVRGGDNMGASQHRRVVGTYPEAGQPETDPEPEENDDTDWAPEGSDIGKWR